MDLSIIGGHSFSPFKQFDSWQFETIVKKKKNRFLKYCLQKSCLNFSFKNHKRNIYLSRRQLVVGNLDYVKDLDDMNDLDDRYAIISILDNYLPPEAHDLRRSNKIDIWSFGCIVYELFNLEKLFNNRRPDKLRESIYRFQVEENLRTEKIKPLYVRIIKRYCLLFNFQFSLTSFPI